MAGDEYSVGGGKLKLKGSKVSGGRVEKKKKKSTKKKEGEATQSKSESTPDTERPESEKDEGVRSGEDRERERDAPGKTEAEKRAEEIRRKRVCYLSIFLFSPLSFCRAGMFLLLLCWTETDFSGQLHERLQREGVKTHKERVEELNKYLSRLSEHHDMYVLLSVPLFIFLGIEGL
jgi:protein FAM32A